MREFLIEQRDGRVRIPGPVSMPNLAYTEIVALMAALALKLDVSAYTAADVLTKVKTVDGSGSGLDADLLDGLDSTSFLSAATYTAADVLAKLLTVDGAGSGLDADLLDGLSSAAFLLAASYTAADVLAKLLTVDGTGSGLDADLLDGLSSAAFAAASHSHAESDITGLVADLALKLNASSYTAADVLTKLLTVDGAGSGLDADLLDGNSSAAFLLASAYTAADVLTKLLTVDGAGSGLDADLLDGLSSAAFAQLAAASVIAAAWNFTTRQQVFGTTTANVALVTGLADTGISIHAVEHIRAHRVASEPFIGLIRVNTSYAAPSALVSGNSAGSITWGGYDGTTVQLQSASIFLDVTETWSGSARGGNLRFQTTTTGTTTKTDRLKIGADSTGAFVQVASGVAAQCGLGFLSDIDCGLRYIGTNHWAAVAGAVDLIDLTTTVATITGNLSLGTAGNKLLVKEGTNASMGVVTLVAGAAVVNTTVVTANSRIQITCQALGTVAVPTARDVTARVAGTSFTITSASAVDTSIIAWWIVEPA